MAILKLYQVKERIKNAEPESPVAVFHVEKNTYEVLFATTVLTAKRIELGEADYMGSFHGKSDPKLIRHVFGGL